MAANDLMQMNTFETHAEGISICIINYNLVMFNQHSYDRQMTYGNDCFVLAIFLRRNSQTLVRTVNLILRIKTQYKIEFQILSIPIYFIQLFYQISYSNDYR